MAYRHPDGCAAYIRPAAHRYTGVYTHPN